MAASHRYFHWVFVVPLWQLRMAGCPDSQAGSILFPEILGHQLVTFSNSPFRIYLTSFSHNCCVPVMHSMFHNTHGGPTSLIEPGLLGSHVSGKSCPVPSWGSDGHSSFLETGRLPGAVTRSLGALRPCYVGPPSPGLYLELCRATPPHYLCG